MGVFLGGSRVGSAAAMVAHRAACAQPALVARLNGHEASPQPFITQADPAVKNR
jgi:hypothetical protein